MRHNSSNRRSRGRGNGKRGNQGRTQVFDSNGPDVKIRGTAHQICDKYVALAKDARSAGDTILAESYLQHAEHYQRMITVWNEQQVERTSYQEEQNLSQPQTAQEGQVDDLSLPSSILGQEVQVEKKVQNVQEKQAALEDA